MTLPLKRRIPPKPEDPIEAGFWLFGFIASHGGKKEIIVPKGTYDLRGMPQLVVPLGVGAVIGERNEDGSKGVTIMCDQQIPFVFESYLMRACEEYLHGQYSDGLSTWRMGMDNFKIES